MKIHFSRFLGIFSLMLLVFGAKSQNIRQTLVENTSDYAVVRIDYYNYQTQTVDVNGEPMQTIMMEKAYPMQEKGSPELLQTSFSLIIPDNSNPEVEVLNAQYSEVQNFSLAPSKGVIFRNVNPGDVAYTKNSSYQSQEYLLGVPAAISHDYQLRDFHGVAIKTFPFDYNPGKKTLKVYSSVTVKINYNSTGFVRAAQKNNRTFNELYSRQFLNYESLYRSSQVTEYGDMLIISPEEFIDAMMPYVEWKTQIGYNVEIVSLSEVGTTSNDVKNYVSDYYNDHNLVFLLIVGDNQQFPTPVIQNLYSDNYFTEIVGGDNYPDIILGKISAENVSHVNTQVERFIDYERNPSNTDHFSVFCGIASMEGGSSSDNGEVDWQHIRNINNKLSAFTYTSGYEFFEGSQGGLDAPGNPSATAVAQAINKGVGIINYCGHGLEDRWVTSNFNNTNVNALTNTGKLPFVLSVACLNGEYAGQTCFAESWLRATHNNEPAGAVGFLGSSMSQPWNQPMCGQDEMIEILVDTTGTKKMETFGGMFFNGLVKMLDTYGGQSQTIPTFRTWILFGDPTLMMRTSAPAELQVDHPAVIPVGNQDVSVASPVENARICLTHGGEILVSGKIENSVCDIVLEEAFTPQDTIVVTVTAQNHIPYEGTIIFIPNEGPFVLCKSITLSDNGNGDNRADYDETVNITPTFANVGNQNSDVSHVTVTADDEYITIINGSYTINGIGAGDEISPADAFTIKVADSVPDKHVVMLQIMTITGNDTTISKKPVKLYAPTLEILALSIDDSGSESANGRLDFGENANLTVSVRNSGNSKTKTGTITVTNPAEEILLSSNVFNANALQKGELQALDVQISAIDSADGPIMTYIKVVYEAGSYKATKYFPIKIGAVVENWETNDFSNLDWQNNSSSPWFLTTQNPYEGEYCVRSGQISSSSSTILRVVFESNVSDTVSFYYRVSSAEGDKLSFLIDNVKKEEWSGVMSQWARAAFPVDSGLHTFTWRYSKDYWWTMGADCAFIDNIEFPSGKISSPVAIDDRSDVQISVMPNPATDFVFVDMPENFRFATYRMFDISGKLVSGGRTDGTRSRISLVNLPQGVYVLEIADGKEIIKTQKIIKN